MLSDLTAEWAGLGAEATLALGHLACCDETSARQVLACLDPALDAFAAGLVQVALGEVDAAFERFSIDEPLGAWPTFAVHHLYGRVWDCVRDDRRYRHLVERARASWRLDTKETA